MFYYGRIAPPASGRVRMDWLVTNLVFHRSSPFALLMRESGAVEGPMRTSWIKFPRGALLGGVERSQG